MSKTNKTPTWQSQTKNHHDSLIGELSRAAAPQPLKELLFPRSLDLNFSFEIKYRL